MTLGVKDVNLKFFENNRTELIQLSITERKQNGIGVTIIDMVTSKTNIDVKYIPIDHYLLEDKIRTEIKKRSQTAPESVLYFCLMLKGDNLIIEVDLNEKNN
jgi:hypothetical protein